LARGRRVRWRDRVVVSMGRWPSRRWMVCRAPPAANRWVAKQCRHGWIPVPWVIPATRVAWAEICCAVAMARGWGRSWLVKSHGAGR
jgi:hypothetical protein